MQTDLANTLAHKVYFVYDALFIISPQALFSPPLGGAGGGLLGEAPGCVLKRGGHTDKRVNHKVNFDFD